MCLFNLIKQHNAVGAAAHSLGQLAALVVAYIARRRADEPCHGVTLHIFGHIKAQQCLLAAEPALGQCAGQLGLTHTGRPQKQHRADGTIVLPQAGAAAAYGGGYRGYSPRLADDLCGKALLQLCKPLTLGLPHTLGGYTARLAHHTGNVCRGQRFFLAAVFGNAACSRGFVQQVDGLIGQIPPRQIPHTQLDCRMDGCGRDGHPMVALIPGHQARENRFGSGWCRLLDHHPPEPPLERRVLLDRFAVFLRRGRTDELYLTARQHRL